MATAAPDRDNLRRLLLRGVAPVVVGVVLGGLIGIGLALVLPKNYTAYAQVLVQAVGPTNTSTNASGGRTNGSINMDTEAQVAKSTPVTDLAGNSYKPLGKYSPDTLSQDIAVTVPANTTVLNIAFTTDSAGGARAGADALATAYLSNRRTTAKNQIAYLQASNQDTAAGINKQLRVLTNKLHAIGPVRSPLRAPLTTQITNLKKQLDTVTQQNVQYLNVPTDPGNVITKAALPSSPSSPRKLIFFASGVGLGLILGLIAAWVLLQFRRTVARADDVERVVDVPWLATLPQFGNTAALVEPFRRLALIARAAAPDARRILVTTPPAAGSLPTSSGEVATGIAGALARGGASTGIVRVNTRGSLSTPARGVEISSFPNADAVTRQPGQSVGDALDLTHDGRDLVVVDAPGAAVSADAPTLSTACDAVVIVADVGSSSRELSAAVHALDEVGAPLLGVVLTQPMSRRVQAVVRSRPSTTEPAENGERPDTPTEPTEPTEPTGPTGAHDEPDVDADEADTDGIVPFTDGADEPGSEDHAPAADDESDAQLQFEAAAEAPTDTQPEPEAAPAADEPRSPVDDWADRVHASMQESSVNPSAAEPARNAGGQWTSINNARGNGNGNRGRNRSRYRQGRPR